MYSFGYFPGVWLWFADVSEPSISSIFKGLKMEPIEGSETSSYNNQTPGKHPKEYIINDNFINNFNQFNSSAPTMLSIVGALYHKL